MSSINRKEDWKRPKNPIIGALTCVEKQFPAHAPFPNQAAKYDRHGRLIQIEELNSRLHPRRLAE